MFTRDSISEKRMCAASRLLPLLELPETAHCICAVGAGGKTSLLYQLVREYREIGKKVLLTTTTKMYLPRENYLLDASAGEMVEALLRKGIIIAGTIWNEEKMGPLSEKVWKEVLRAADIVLVEADGSRRLPLKAPANTEPVLPEECDFLIVVEGVSGIGKPMETVCHRSEEAARLLQCEKEHKITEKDVALLAQKGYGFCFGRQKDRTTKDGIFLMNQMDVLNQEQTKKMMEAMQGLNTVFASLHRGIYWKDERTDKQIFERQRNGEQQWKDFIRE